MSGLKRGIQSVKLSYAIVSKGNREERDVKTVEMTRSLNIATILMPERGIWDDFWHTMYVRTLRYI